MSLRKLSLRVLYTLALVLPLAISSTASAEPVAHEHHGSSKTVSVEELEERPKTKLKIAKTDTVIHVGDLHCKHCAKKIASKLYAVKGVVKVRTDLKADVAIVSPQSKKKLDPVALWKAAQKSGFPAVKLVGPDGTYVLDAKSKQPKLLAEKKEPSAKS